MLCNCGKSFKHRQSRFKHELKCGNNIVFNLSCKTCNYQTSLKDTMLRHSRICKGKKLLAKCKSCNLSFKCRSDLQRHESVHKKEELKCTCNKRFAHQDHFNEHVDICQKKQDGQNFKCENCGKKFRVRKRLVKHKVVCLKLTERSLWFEDNLINVAEDMSSFNSFFLPPQKPTSVFPSMAVEENNFTDVIPTVESIMLGKSSDELDHQISV